MTISELIAIRKCLPTESTKGSIQTKYKIAKFLKATEDDETFFNETMKKIIFECTEKDEDGNVKQAPNGGFFIKPEEVDSFNERVSELNDTEATNVDIRFTIDELSYFELSAKDLIALDNIID